MKSDNDNDNDSGIRGYRRRVERRKKENNGEFYRHGKNTLKQRVRKKLTEKTTWYREKKKKHDEEEGVREKRDEWRVRLGKVEKREGRKEKREDCSKKIKAVMFVPFTRGSKLARLLRQNEEHLEKITGYRMKIVERSGTKLEDILTSSNPWIGEDCGREGCLLCYTKAVTGKNMKQSCTKRSVTYQTWCEECRKREEEKNGEDGEEKIIPLHTYIGETSRSSYERGREHIKDVEQLNTGSHILKHIVEVHEGVDPARIEFRMKAVKYHQSAFERQIYESVKIQSIRKSNILLNSKSEYNRCALPRISLKLGENEFKARKDEEEEDKKREEDLVNKIKELKKERNKNRRKYPRNQPTRKRMKMDDGSQAICLMEKGEDDRGEKRQGEELEKVAGRLEKKRRMCQQEITEFVYQKRTESGQAESDNQTRHIKNRLGVNLKTLSSVSKTELN